MCMQTQLNKTTEELYKNVCSILGSKFHKAICEQKTLE